MFSFLTFKTAKTKTKQKASEPNNNNTSKKEKKKKAVVFFVKDLWLV